MSFLELSLKLKGFPFDEAEKELARIKSLSESDFKKWQENKKWEIVRYHFENTEFYRDKLGGKLPERWEDLPVLVKSDFQNSKKKIISDKLNESDIYRGFTSGSTGQPFNYAKSKFSHAMTWALIKDRYRNFGLNLKSRQARFYGIPLEKKDYVIEKIKDFVSNRVRFPVFDLSDEVLEKYLDRFRRIRFEYIYGYSNTILLFARYLWKKKIILKEVCPSLKVCICTSENCTEEDKKIIYRAFQFPVVNEYGASEVDLIAFEDIYGNWKFSDENVFTEILDENGDNLKKPGEGRLVLTSLHNKAMPVIRYEIGDNILIEPEGNKFKVKALLGCTGDDILLPSGKTSSSVTFHYITRDVLEKSGILKEFIIKQVSLNKFVYEIVADDELPQHYVDLIKEKVDLYLEPGLDVEIKRVDSIMRTKAGKMKHFHSLLKNQNLV